MTAGLSIHRFPVRWYGRANDFWDLRNLVDTRAPTGLQVTSTELPFLSSYNAVALVVIDQLLRYSFRIPSKFCLIPSLDLLTLGFETIDLTD